MPLVPVERLTGKPKSLEQFTDAEAEHWADQVIDEQKNNKMLNRPVDLTALDKADALLKPRKLDVARKRISDARITLGAKP
jgi:hypothetical protein